mmetsp:Transcript_8763/g.8082  ORF Transcript_8763/g.8082 Transcript_8763/m.8082 type:complete len:107 (+) Transcript_8763:2549-2869(+)
MLKEDDSLTFFKAQQAIDKIHSLYSSKEMSDFIENLNMVLKIIQSSTLQHNDSVVNLIFSVFLSFYPEVHEHVQLDKQQQEEEAKKEEEKGEEEEGGIIGEGEKKK